MTLPLTVAPAAGVVNPAVSGVAAVPLRRVTDVLVLPVRPLASRTDAVSTCGPSATLAVFQGIATGPVDEVVVVPTARPATLSV